MIDRFFSVADVKVRANVATELRDSIEPLCSGASYPIFLAKLWPVFKNILKGDPVFFSMSYEQVRDLAGDVASACALEWARSNPESTYLT